MCGSKFLCLGATLFTIFLFAPLVTSDAATQTTAELRKQHAAYDQALVALGNEEYESAIEQLHKLSGSDNAALAADATFFLGRAYFMQEQLEEAKPLFAKVAGDLADLTDHAGEALYHRGLCEAGLLDHHQATDTLTDFLRQFPHAPAHQRETAEEKLAQLRSLEEGSLDDVQRRMDFSRRRLTLHDTGEVTQVEQDNVVKLLTDLIGDEGQDQPPGNCPNCPGGT